jgi:hypothetical protein
MAQRFTLDEIRTRTYKDRDAWWTVWLVDPLASRLVWLVAPVRWITPNLLTMGAFLLGFVAAYCFLQGDYPWLVAGAVVFHISFVLDCMDGKPGSRVRARCSAPGWTTSSTGCAWSPARSP